MNELDLFGETLGRTSPATRDEAAERAERIRSGMVAILTMEGDIKKAWAARDWAALGYDSWESYVVGEFGEHRFPRLNRHERRELVSRLRDGSMSTRAIGAVLGVDQKTVVNDLRAGEEFSSPEPARVERINRPASATQEDAQPRAEAASPPAQTRTRGTDGKSYQASRPRPAAPASLAAPQSRLLMDDDVVDAEIVDEPPAVSTPSPADREALGSFIEADPTIPLRAWRAKFMAAIERTGAITADFKVETVTANADHQLLVELQAVHRHLGNYIDRINAQQPTGLRLVQGD